MHQLPSTLLSLRLLLSPSVCYINSTQQLPPPLPKGHPSPSLLARLFLEVPRIVEETRSDFEQASGTSYGSGVKTSKKLFSRNSHKDGARGFSDDSSNNNSNGAGGPAKLTSKFKKFGLGSKKDGRPGSSSSHPGQGADAARGSGAGLGAGGKQHLLHPSPPSLVPINSDVFYYLDALSALCKAVTFRFLAIAAGEESGGGSTEGASGMGEGQNAQSSSSSGGRHAEAIVWLRMASSELSRLATSPGAKEVFEVFVGKADGKSLRARLGGKKDGADTSSGNAGNNQDGGLDGQPNPLDSSSSSSTSPSQAHRHPLSHRLQSYHSQVLTSELNQLAHCTNVYTRLNDSVSFQRLPTIEDLWTKIPGPRNIVTFSPVGSPASWSAPRPEFGPGSTASAESSRATLGSGGAEDSSKGLILGRSGGTGEYAGASGDSAAGAGGTNAGYVGSGAYY